MKVFKPLTHFNVILILFSIWCTPKMYAQNILIEEFTNLSATEYRKSHTFLDSVTQKLQQKKFLTIKYHTGFPEADTFNNPVKNHVMNRMNTLGAVNFVPKTIVDGKQLSTGQYPKGHTLNTSSQFLDSVIATKNINVDFFGVSLVFTDDFKSIIGSSGAGTTTGLVNQTVFMTRALVEEVVDMDQPVGPDGFQNFTNIFRGYISYRESFVIAPSGSFHGGAVMKLPKEIERLSNLKMIVYLEDVFGKVIDCDVIHAPFVDQYKIEITNTTAKHTNYCLAEVSPGIKITNKCPYTIPGFTAKIKINNEVSTKMIVDEILPGVVKTYLLDTLNLPPGRHYIDTEVESVLNSSDSLIVVKTNGTVRYLVKGNHEIIEEDFENPENGDTGHFMVRSQNDFTFVPVNATDLNHSEPIGGYGASEHALMVDLWEWKYDTEDAGLIYLPDNKNFAFLLYNQVDLSGIKYPSLYFDVATTLGKNFRGIEIGASLNTCGNNYTLLTTFTPAELTKLPALRTAKYIPKKEDWLTKKISLDDYEDANALQLRFFTSCPRFAKDGNVMYLDNFRIKSDTALCAVGDVSLGTQNEVQNFVRDYSDCNILQGNICIGKCGTNTGSSTIADISGLNFIREIQGSLTIQNNVTLTSLKGLDFLMKIDGEVNIINNPKLTSTTMLSPKSPVGKGIRVENNPLLQDISFYTANTVIDGDFIVKNNPLLKNIGSLLNLQKINGDFIVHNVEGNILNTSASGLKFVNGHVSIQNNPGLASLLVLRYLESVEGDFILRNNPKLGGIYINVLRHIGGDLILEDCENDVYFPSPDSLGGSLVLRNNKKLTNVSIFNNIDTTFFYSNAKDSFAFIAENNPLLKICNTPFICWLLESDSLRTLVSANGQGCQNKEVVNVSCSPSHVEGFDTLPKYLYPNPTSDKIYIPGALQSGGSLRMYDHLGNLVLFQETIETGEISVSNLPSGVYSLVIFDKVFRVVKI